MNTEIQETIAELRALIRLMEPLLKKLEEHLTIMEKKNDRHEKHALPTPEV